jgi:Cysteine-rich CPXCG
MVRFADDLPDGFDSDESHVGEVDVDLDRDFPLGDGTAEGGATVTCPYCAESVDITLDPGSGSTQEYVEDCEVCCQPWCVSVSYRGDGSASVTVTTLDSDG